MSNHLIQKRLPLNVEHFVFRHVDDMTFDGVDNFARRVDASYATDEHPHAIVEFLIGSGNSVRAVRLFTARVGYFHVRWRMVEIDFLPAQGARIGTARDTARAGLSIDDLSDGHRFIIGQTWRAGKAAMQQRLDVGHFMSMHGNADNDYLIREMCGASLKMPRAAWHRHIDQIERADGCDNSRLEISRGTFSFGPRTEKHTRYGSRPATDKLIADRKRPRLN
jgi:hypothetical protein